MSEEELSEIADEALVDAIGDDSTLLPRTDADRRRIESEWALLSQEGRDVAVKQAQVIWIVFVTTFFEYLSAMVHRFPLSYLVRSAVAGNDEALVQAIQVDRTILIDLPYAVERYRRAARESDSNFLNKLSYRLANPMLHGKIRFRQLWWALAFLDSMNLLDGSLSNKALFDLLDRAGLDRYENRVESVEYFSKRLGEFRRFQRHIS